MLKFKSGWEGFESNEEDVHASENDSRKYSDEVSSDVEEELYSLIHHSSNINSSDRVTDSETFYSKKGDSNNDSVKSGYHFPKKALVEEVLDRKLDKSNASKAKTNVELVNLTKNKVNQTYSARTQSSVEKKTDASDSSTYSDPFCDDFDSASEDSGSNLLTNVHGLNKPMDSDQDLICISSSSDENPDLRIKKKRKKNVISRRQFKPIVIDTASCSDVSSSSQDELVKSAPPKLQRCNKVHMSSSDPWHLSIEDRYPPRKSQKRFFNQKKSASETKPLKCFVCGENHKSSECRNKVCSCCYQKGHIYRRCPNRARLRRTHCNICKIQGHSSNLCPDLWRRFHLTTTPERIVKSPKNASDSGRKYCYNCAQRGHLGFECLEPKQGYSGTWPYVISYKKPEESIRSNNCESNVTDNDRNSRLESAFHNDNKRHSFLKVHQTISENGTSTPVNSQFGNNSSPHSGKRRRKHFSKKRKLVFQEQGFSRTPNSFKSSDINNNNSYPKISKRRRNKKGKKRTE